MNEDGFVEQSSKSQEISSFALATKDQGRFRREFGESAVFSSQTPWGNFIQYEAVINSYLNKLLGGWTTVRIIYHGVQAVSKKPTTQFFSLYSHRIQVFIQSRADHQSTLFDSPELS